MLAIENRGTEEKGIIEQKIVEEIIILQWCEN